MEVIASSRIWMRPLLIAMALGLSTQRTFAATPEGTRSMASPNTEMRFTEAPEPRRDETSVSRYRWEQVENESLALVGPYGTVWRLNFSPGLTKPHFHPLNTADGRPLTWVAPADHPWHYGLWHSWKLINGVNYWEEDEKTGRAEGTTRIIRTAIEEISDRAARVRIHLTYHPANEPEKVVMNEVVDLSINVPDDNGLYRIDWRQESTAVGSPVMLDRTPLPHEPNGKPYGGYGGLSFRASPFLREVTVLNSDGIVGAAAHRQPAAWMRLNGAINGRPAAVTIFDAPANLRHPRPWFVELRPDLPFNYINPALLHDGPITVEPGVPLVQRFLIRVDSRLPDQATLADEFQAFIKRKP